MFEASTAAEGGWGDALGFLPHKKPRKARADD